MKRLLEKLTALLKQQIKDNIWARIGLVLSIVVVFCTTYVLVLPALTLTSSSTSSVIQEQSSASSVLTESSTSATESSISSFATSTQDVSTPASSATEASQTDATQAGSQTADGGNVTVKVNYEAGTFAEKVTLKVTPITDNQSLVNKIQDVLNDSKQSLISSYSYDISFVNEAGAEVEPSKEVKVSMNFKNAVESSNLQEGWKLYHFKDNDVNQVEDLTEKSDTDIKQDDKESVTSVDFKSDTFSAYTIAGVKYEDFKTYVQNGSFEGTTTETTSGNTKTLSTELKLHYYIPLTELNKSKSYAIELPADTTWDPKVQENYEYTGKDGLDDAYKYKFVQQDGKRYLVLTFLDTYVTNARDHVKGDIKYAASIGQTYRKDDGSYEIPFTDKVTITVPSDKINKTPEQEESKYDVDSNKYGSVTYDGDNAYLNYTVEVSSNKGTKDVVNLTDTLTVNGFKIENFEKLSVIRTDSNGATTDLTNSTNLNYSNGKFTTQLPKLSANQKYKITYRYKISGFPAGKSTYVGNGLDVTTSDVPNKHKDNQLEVYRNKISKSGSYDKDTNKIKWTITVNENQNDIAGTELKDDMLAKASDITISPSTGATKTTTGYTFTATDGNKNTNKYLITYYTDAGEKPDSWNAQAKNFTNTATFTDGGESSGATATVPGGKGNTGGLTKTFEKMEATNDSKLKTLTWTSTIKVSGDGIIPAGTEFTDTLMGNSGSAWTEHYYTKDQMDAIYNLLVEKFGAGNFDFSVWESGQNTWQWSNYDSSDSQKTYRQFKFKLLKDYRSSKNIDLTYTSTANVESVINFDNTISTNGFSQTASYRYEVKSKITKMDGVQDTSDGKEFENKDTSHTINADGTITWAVKVALEDNSKSVTITDTPPAGLTLVNVKYGVRWGNTITLTPQNNQLSFVPKAGEYSDYYFTVNGAINEDGSISTTFNAKEGSTLKSELKPKSSTYGDSLYVWYTFKTNDGALDDTVIKSYTNKAFATVDGVPSGEDDHTQTITITPSQKIDKSGKWNNDDRAVDYNVTLNPSAQDLAAGKDSYTVKDTLEYQEDTLTNLSYDLKQDSVKLFYDDGTPVESNKWSWTVEKVRESNGLYKSILKLTVPNNKKLKLEYKYEVTRDVDADNTAQLSVKNTAEIDGLKTGKKETTTYLNWSNMATSGTASTVRFFKLTKVDINNFVIVLPNALFEVRENGTDKVVATYKTATDGTLNITKDGTKAERVIEPLEDNKLYYVTEVQAPSGYKLPDDSKRYYFYFSETGLAPLNLGGLTDISSAVNLAKQSKQEYVTNEQLPPTTSITVDKKWQKADGTDTQVTSGSITYDIMQVATKSDNTTSETAYKSGETMSHDDNWSKSYTDLPTAGTDADGNAVTYTYYVKEATVSGYSTSYENASGTTSDNPSELAVANGTLTVTNKAQKQYNLPKTGGSGIERLMAAGIALAVTASFVLGYQAFKKYQLGGQL